MKSGHFHLLLIIPVFLIAPGLSAQHAEHFAGDNAHRHHEHAAVKRALNFQPNRGQWDERISYAAELGGFNQLFLEEGRLTYVLYDEEQSHEVHDVMRSTPGLARRHHVKGHAYTVEFVGAERASFQPGATTEKTKTYLLGNDPGRWAKNVPAHERVTYANLYPGVDLAAYSVDGNFKYDFLVAPGADASVIQLDYEGLDKVYLKDGELVLETSVGTVRESHPYVYQQINGREVVVACDYVLNGNRLSFDFPSGYDAAHPLIIDPTVVGATLAGSSDNQTFGHSATFDNGGNIYTAGISFGQGYPTTSGAFERNFAGGNVDIVISKFNTDGTDLLYSTYIGGANAEYPYSIIVDANGQLSYMGSTDSPDYPTTANAIQRQNRGRNDVVVTKLNAAGNGLVGSTMLGGSGEDGPSLSAFNTDSGDRFRGEIVLDAVGNIYVASCSASPNFPVSPNAFQPTLVTSGGGTSAAQDGVVFKLNSDLSTVFWSTYLGGSGPDLCSALRVDDENNVYVTGYAGGADFPMADGGVTPAWPGGDESAFLVKLSANGSAVLNGTFWGTEEVDRGYFVDIDEDDQVHIFGTTQGVMPVTPDTWVGNEGSGQFLVGFSSDLASVVYSTVIGTGPYTGVNRFSEVYDFIPVAFMVDKCNGIYLSGYQSKEGLPVTPDNFSTVSNSFYLAKLEPNAADFDFGTYYGMANHVDGGTSRFDKGGVVYQGVCSCIDADNDRTLNTTPGAWREQQETRCDVGVFKVDFDVDVVTAQGVAAPSASGCAPFTVDFTYTGRDAVVISWEFGNGDTAGGPEATYTFEEAGSYRVMQVALAPMTCNLRDTIFLQIDVLDGNSTREDLAFCAGDEITFLDATTNNASYAWQDGSTVATYQPEDIGTYWVDVSVTGCTRRDSFVLNNTSALAVELGEDLLLCDIASVTLDATHPDAAGYRWQDGTGAARLNAVGSGTYAVTVTDAFGCEVMDAVDVTLGQSPALELGPDLERCANDPPLLDATSTTNEVTYRWEDGTAGPTRLAGESGSYTVSVTSEGCTSVDSVRVDIRPAPQTVFTVANLVCPGESNGVITASTPTGGNRFTYRWSTGAETPGLTGLPSGDYGVSVVNETGCVEEQTVVVPAAVPTTFDIDVTNVSCDDLIPGDLAAAITGGGRPPYTFALGSGPFGETVVFDNLRGGNYLLRVRDADGCISEQTATITSPNVAGVEAGPDRVISLGDSTLLEGLVSNAIDVSFAWTPDVRLNCADCLITIAKPVAGSTIYTLSVTDLGSGCVYADSLRVIVNRDRAVYIPSAFSPNGDGINDRFFINTDRSVAGINYLRIYERWGGMVYERENFAPNAPDLGWDGNIRGKFANPRVFIYVAELTFVDGETRRYEGDLTLMR